MDRRAEAARLRAQAAVLEQASRRLFMESFRLEQRADALDAAAREEEARRADLREVRQYAGSGARITPDEEGDDEP